MYIVSQRFKDAVKQSHTILPQMESWRGLETPVDFTVLDGNIELDLDATSRRSMNLTVIDADQKYDAQDILDLLDIYTAKVRMSMGFVYPDTTTEYVPQGTFYPTEIEMDDDNYDAVQITALDVSVKCQDPMPRPYLVQSGSFIYDTIPPLLMDRFGGLDFRLSKTPFYSPSLLLPEESNAWSAACDLAETAGQQLYVDRLDTVTMEPRISATKTAADWSFVEGENADFWKTRRLYTADSYPNVVVVVGTNSAFPNVRGEAADLDPKSKTYRYGNYGEKVRIFKSEKVSTSNQAQQMAVGILARLLGPSEQMSFNAIPNPALDVGDTISITRANLGIVDQRMIVSKLTLPFKATEEMSVTCRRSVFTDPVQAYQAGV